MGLFLLLSAVFIICIGAGYYAADLRPTGHAEGEAPYLFFDHLPWMPFAASFLGLVLASRTRRVACYIDRENERVLRMDFGAQLGHWMVALPCIFLMISGLALGVFFIPRLTPEPLMTAAMFNVHFVGVGFFYVIGLWILSPRRLDRAKK